MKVYLEQGLSLIQIGALENRDPSTVGYWVRKYGLEANGAGRHAPKGAIDRDLLAELVSEGLRLREIAGEVGRSISTVRYWIGKHGLDAPKAARRGSIRWIGLAKARIEIITAL